MNRMLSVMVILFLATLPAARNLAAQSPGADSHSAQPERPTVATHAGTVAPGYLEVEAGTEFDRYSSGSRGGSGPILFKLGIAPRFQLNVQTPIARPVGASSLGIGDVAVGMKWRIAEGAPIVGDFAVLPSLKAPSGSIATGSGTGTTDFSLLLISSHEFGPISADLNLGYTHRSGDGSTAPRNATLWTAAAGGPGPKKIGWAAEIYGYPGTAGAAGSPPIVALLGGPTLQLRNALVLDAGAIAPLTGPQPRAIYAGVVYNVGRLRK